MKFLNIKNLATYLSTFLNILKIYFITNKKLRNNNKSKFIFFYFPVKAYQENILELANKLKKNKNIFVFLIYNKLSSLGMNDQKNSFLLDLRYLRFIPFSDILLQNIHLFLSNYVAYIFPPNSKNIYISLQVSEVITNFEENPLKVIGPLKIVDKYYIAAAIRRYPAIF